MCLAMPGRVLSVDAGGTCGRVDVLGASRTVDLSLVDDVRPGEWVLVQMGSAVARMSEADAVETAALFEELAATLAGDAASADVRDGACGADTAPVGRADVCEPGEGKPAERTG